MKKLLEICKNGDAATRLSMVIIWGRLLRQRTICQGNHYDSDRSTVLSVHISFLLAVYL